MMKRILFPVLLTLLGLSGKSQTSVGVQEIKGGLQSPESVTAKGNFMYVSNMGAKADPNAKDGDGYISQLSRKGGKMMEEKFITGLNSPKGIKIIRGMIFVADIDRVVAFNIKTKKQEWEVSLADKGETYLNDISIRRCGSIFVSSTDKNKIYKICRNRKVKELAVKGTIEGTNGLFKGTSRLYVANYGHGAQPDGSFGYIPLCSKKYKILHAGGIYDGVQKVCHRMIVSDWVNRSENKGKIVVFNVCKKKYSELALGKTLGGPSDIYADCKTKTLWVPCMLDNSLVAIPYSMIKSTK